MNEQIDPLALLRESADHPRVATIGTFDGVHRGHQRLIAHARANAASRAVPLTVITFDQPPVAVLRPDRFPGAIVSLDRKLELLRAAGADEVLVVPFTRELSQVTAGEFMDVLAHGAEVVDLSTGEGFALGHKREGTVDVLARLASQRNMRFEAIERLGDERGIVSSSAIRNGIAAGEVDTAAASLGRWHQVAGEVVRGDQVGREIGYPTANLVPAAGLVPLADGIYASMTHLPGRPEPIPSMTYIGTRPAINTGQRVIETHLFDFNDDLYGQILKVDVLRRIRGDANFSSVDEVIAQLRRDEAATREVLARQVTPIGTN